MTTFRAKLKLLACGRLTAVQHSSKTLSNAEQCSNSHGFMIFMIVMAQRNDKKIQKAGTDMGSMPGTLQMKTKWHVFLSADPGLVLRHGPLF